MPDRDDIVAVVLAAGVGSRLDPLTRQLPKPMVPFINRPVMQHVLELLKRHHIRTTVSNVHYQAKKVIDYFGSGQDLGMNMRFVREPSLTGDAGGVRACREYLQGRRLLVVMGDLITDMDLSYVLDQHEDKGVIATIALKQVSDVERFGVAVLNQDLLITGFQEKPGRKEARSNLASTGIYVLEPEVLDLIGSQEEVGFGKSVFPRLIEEGLPVQGVEVWGYWSDVGTIDQYRSSTFDALSGLVDVEIPGQRFANGWRGEGSSISGRARLNGTVLLGCNSQIAAGVTVDGFAVIGDNCFIDKGAHLENSIVWSGTVIGANAHLCQAVIGAGCRVPAGATVRNQATIEWARPFGAERVQAEIAAAQETGLLVEAALPRADELQSDLDLR